MTCKRHIVYGLILLCFSACTHNAETLYRQGRQAREANEPVAAMEAFIAATRCPTRDYAYKGRSYSNMATMSRMAERHELAYALYELSAFQFANADDWQAYAYALNNMAWEQAVLGHKQEACLLADSAVRICPKEDVRTKIRETRTAACYYVGEYDSVLLYTQKTAMESTYFAILRAQSFTFLNEYDSALLYARRVVEKTDNPRYLDDAFYILTHCDTTASADSIRILAARRTDIQRSLERNNSEWSQALLLAEEAVSHPDRPVQIALWAVFLFMAGIAVWLLIRYAVLKSGRRKKLENECRALRQCTNLKEELYLTDYKQFCAVCNARLMGIADKLDRRGLSEREIRICVLVLIGLPYTEIADVLYRAESGIGKDKYLIAKRLGVRTKDLQTTLRTIACNT